MIQPRLMPFRDHLVRLAYSSGYWHKDIVLRHEDIALMFNLTRPQITHILSKDLPTIDAVTGEERV